MLFFATTINYLDRQVLSLTWMDFIAPEFHWTNVHYGKKTGIFSIMYATGVLFAGMIVDRLGTKKGYLWAILVWSAGACVHALCSVITQDIVGLDSAQTLRMAQGVDVVARITTVSVSLFMFARSILAMGGRQETSRLPLRLLRNSFRKRTGDLPQAFSMQGQRLVHLWLLSQCR
ncbi:MAG: hypothetical protein LMBGKNDO_01455 [Bacteroidales bacterium]|jgi:ACS family hexuronate transporter-like MFS transporter|nr:hypothetical protein [Bacteroidales bacterium]OQC58385.1 MAG: putative glucarate transporter [Bacteroidetes bacterium ADurb.Bin013]